MTLRFTCVLLIICMCGSSIETLSAASRDITDNDGQDWCNWDNSMKIGFLLGYITAGYRSYKAASMLYELRSVLFPLAEDPDSPPPKGYLALFALQSDLSSHCFFGIQTKTIIDCIDMMYEMPRNRRIVLLGAMDYAACALHGASDSTLASRLTELRRTGTAPLRMESLLRKVIVWPDTVRVKAKKGAQ